MSTPTDGEWMSAQEALDRLGLGSTEGARAICRHAGAELVKAKARRLLVHGTLAANDAEISYEFWLALTENDEAMWQDWKTGYFETTFNNRRFEAFGVQFRRSDIKLLKPASAANPIASPSPAQRPAGRTVFIGHGHSSEWLKLKEFLSGRLHLSPIEFNSIPAAGVATTERLMEMLDQADFAFLILTAEDERSDGKFGPRLNVVHEAGLFQGRLSFKRAIILLEEGCDNFSNVHGLNDIRFPKGSIEAAFEKVRGVLEREKLI
jgi:predicted nucleotide-binding protein